MAPHHPVYEFGEFHLDRDERVLRRGTATVPLTPKATEILLALIDDRGHIVEKTDLMRQVWSDTAVEEGNLSQNIYTLRRGDAAAWRKPLQVFPLSPTHCGRTVRWSPDSGSLAYIDCSDGVSNIWTQKLDGSPPRKLTDFSSGHITTFDWSRDGTQLAWIVRNQVSDVVLVAH